jgi:hypothetical protein
MSHLRLSQRPQPHQRPPHHWHSGQPERHQEGPVRHRHSRRGTGGALVEGLDMSVHSSFNQFRSIAQATEQVH